MEQQWNEMMVTPKKSEIKLSQWGFVHHKFQMDCPGRELGSEK
jgi:hypothetical protein